jgi:hypothetical protein
MADYQPHDQADRGQCDCADCNDDRDEQFWHLLVDHSEVEAEQALEHYRTPHELRGQAS